LKWLRQTLDRAPWLWNLKRYIADRKLAALKAGRDLYGGRN
jgi:hypothetical protein